MKGRYEFLKFWRWIPVGVFLGAMYSAGALLYMGRGVRGLFGKPAGTPVVSGKAGDAAGTFLAQEAKAGPLVVEIYGKTEALEPEAEMEREKVEAKKYVKV